MPAGVFRSLTLTAFSASFMVELSAMATPGPTLRPFLIITGSSLEKVPMTSDTFAPGTPLPLRWPETPKILTTFFVATGSNSSAPGCLSSTLRRSAAMSNLSTPMTWP